jgi:Xaa-Pro aminopeptidase
MSNARMHPAHPEQRSDIVLYTAGMRKSARRLGLLLLAALFAAPPAPALEREPWNVFAERRARLLEKHPDGVTVLFAYIQIEGSSLRTAFRQENNFYYLTGWDQPGAVLLLLPPMRERNSPAFDEVSALPREILYLPPRDPRQEQWTGPKTGPYEADIQQRTGFSAVRPTEVFESDLAKAVTGFGRVYLLQPRQRAADMDPEPERVRTVEKIVPTAEIKDARPALTSLRMVKSPGEITFIQKATDATLAAHRAAWKRARRGVYEYQVAAAMLGVMFERGCERPAYTPIVGAGFNSTVLHYAENSHRLDAGQVLLMDVGGEYSMYATDITRTIPVGGRFTPRQRELYEIVLGAQKAALAALRPGMTLSRTGENSLYKIAYDYINSRGKDKDGNPLGKYFIHGLGHHIGLEVHDPASYETPLAPGMVITIEPGIYIPEERIGIRIEDVVVVTGNGYRNLSAALPREIEEIERATR